MKCCYLNFNNLSDTYSTAIFHLAGLALKWAIPFVFAIKSYVYYC